MRYFLFAGIALLATSCAQPQDSVFGSGQPCSEDPSQCSPGNAAGTAGGSGGGIMGGMGMGGAGSAGVGGAEALGLTARIAVLDNATPYDPTDPNGQLQNDLLTVLDPAQPNAPLFELSGLAETEAIGTLRLVATSKSKKRLGVIDFKSVRVFDENFQPLANFASFSGYAPAIYPTDQDIFVLRNTQGTISTGKIVRFDLNGVYLGGTTTSHGVDMVVDEDRQVVWTVGQHLTRAPMDLSSEEQLHKFVWAAVSLDLDSNGGVWAAEREHGQVAESADRLVHFDVNGNKILADLVPLPGSPMSVRVDRNSGLVWVAMLQGGVGYRDTSGQFKTVPGLTGTWDAVEPDPFDSTSVWAADRTQGQVVHVDMNGNILQSFGGFSKGTKCLAVMLSTP